MKHIKYYLSIFLSLFDVIIIAAGVAGIIYGFTSGSNLSLFSILAIVIAALLLKPLHQLRIRYRRDVEYDEYGVNKRTKYDYLSKEQRDQIDLQNMAIMESLVSSTALKKMTKTGSKEPLKDLNKLIGLNNVKEQVKKIEARLRFEQQRNRSHKADENVSSGKHLVFYGAPGTGKTTVARIITGILYNNRVIEKNKCLEIDGNFLNAGASSGQKTDLVIRAAKGGVLFIDEAYAMISNPEAIATLIKQIEDCKNEFVLIMAGYTEPMKELIDSNPGFHSRIRDYINFADYNSIELRDIANSITNDNGLVLDENALDIFDAIMLKEKRSANFGNARTVRSVIDKAIDQHAYRLMQGELDKKYMYRLMKEDFVF